ncbi:glycosyltransferase family 4 protein [Neptunitalea lumnitzerae]|uniref:Glycoside hydrolase n=1 Tax=Neptunitalea lumnitzerae TaxID=2965509 RepID=A0ABQ5MPE5_9FLAO|nr:glycosyltransferase family 4 protein [Neptunitalea sp. Y10]GLB50847.1 glycoside hydrolase [Neptunitalea sp. Y10]
MAALSHVGYIVSHYPHKAFGHDGGLGTSVYNLVENLSEKIKVSVFVYGQQKDFVITEGNQTLYSIKSPATKLGFYYNRKHIEQFVNDKIKKDHIQLIEAPDWTGITALMNFPVPLVIRFHGSDAYFCHIEGRKQKFKNKLFESLAVKNAHSYIAPTTFAGEVSKELFKIKDKEVRTIHYGLELEKFHNPSPDDFEEGLVLYMGTLIRKKGVLELPEIMQKVVKEYPNAKLLMAGSDAPDIRTGANSTWQLMQDKMSEEVKGCVTYLGRVPYTEISELVKKAHVCVFPTYAETLGMVTIESMVMQKPVVNSNIGWAQELMEDGKSGYLVHPSNHDLYAERIVALLKDKELCKQMGVEAKKYVTEKFDIKKQVDKNIAYYEEILS